VHILLVPKRAIGSLADLRPEDEAVLADIFEVTQALVQEFDLAKQGYSLIINGGAYQEVPQLHVHLVAGQQV
jgi:diadenosine tetraphosphate (Ap4A) HIT family hydrolase